MKYIKTYEHFDMSSFRNLIVKFLEKNIPESFRVVGYYNERGEKKGEALALTSYDYRKNVKWRNDITILSIRIMNVNDKQLRGKPKTKFKVYLKTCYDTSNVEDKDFLNNLIIFLNDIFRKYSYYNKIHHHSYFSILKQDYEYFLNTSDIDNILKDFENFQMYLNSKKYNI